MLPNKVRHEASSPASWSYLLDSETFLSSPELLQELGLPPNSPFGMSDLLNNLTAISAQLFKEALKQLQKKPSTLDILLTFEHVTDRLKSCRLQPLFSGQSLCAIQGQFYAAFSHKDHDMITQHLLRYQSIFDYTQTGIAYGDHLGNILDCNPYFCELLGYSPGDLTSKNFRDFTHPEDLALEDEQAIKLVRGDLDSFYIEKRYLRADQSIVWVGVNITAVRNQDNEPLNFIGVVTDISARKEAEVKLAEQSNFLNTLLGSVDDLVTLIDERGQILKVWSNRPQEFPIAIETLVGQQVDELVDFEFLQVYEKLSAQVFESEETLSIEFPSNLNPNRWNIFTFNALPKQPGHSLRQILVTVRDITSQKQAEMRLENFQEQLQQLNRITFDSNLIDEKRIEQALKKTLAYLGLKQAYVILFQQAENVQLYTYPEQLQKSLSEELCTALRDWPQMIYHRLQLPENWCFQAPDDASLPAFIAHPFHAGQQVRGTICFTSLEKVDLNTYQLQFLRILAHWIGNVLDKKYHLDQLKALNQNQERILSVLSHDLRNSLSSVIGFCQVIKRRNMATPKTLELIERIQNAGHNANQLLQEMLTVQELEGARTRQYFGMLSLNPLLESILVAFASQAREKGIHFTYKLLEKSPELYLHQIWFSRLVENLLSNALKFTPDQGSIDVYLKENEDAFCLIVEDTGIGIPESLQPLIFEKFSEARRPGVRGEVSTGLGMYIIEQIVRMHQGKIWFESQEGQGSRFYVSLPRKIG